MVSGEPLTIVAWHLLTGLPATTRILTSESVAQGRSDVWANQPTSADRRLIGVWPHTLHGVLQGLLCLANFFSLRTDQQRISAL